MTKKLQDPTNTPNNSDEETPSTDSDSSDKPGGVKSLFGCCFKFVRKKKPDAANVDYNPNEYDYIVEKLVVKRVPLALFALSKDVSDRDNDDAPQGTSKSQFSTETKSFYSVLSEEQSLYHTTNQNANLPHGKCLRFDKTLNARDESNVCLTSTDYDNYEEQKSRARELMNTLTAYYPDLKESERAPKDPCPLNMPVSKRSFAESITEAASIKENTNKEEDLPETNSKSDELSNPSRDENASSSRDPSDDDIEKKSRFIVSPVQLQYTPQLLENSNKEISSHQHDVENYNRECSDRQLGNNKNSDNSTVASTGATEKTVDEENAVLRWKIIIKHHEPRPLGSTAFEETNLNEQSQ